jgi:hypothetical protein
VGDCSAQKLAKLVEQKFFSFNTVFFFNAEFDGDFESVGKGQKFHYFTQ